ncbi:MAG TPA: PfkB family carbohydrate kinase [Trebonia sp.]|jgi:sugar/nucleoside kinase (ribokinase family)|nr:PfkB family carbohydrate kinase [Trebonia sp.]
MTHLPHPAGPRRLVFAGEAIVDVAAHVPGLPGRGGDVLASSSGVTVGGGFNVMAAAARQGMAVLYAGGHGTGPWGDLVRTVLAGEGIGVLRAPDPLRDTGFVVVLVEPGGERTFVTSLGAESFHDLAALTALPGDVVYVSGYGLLGPSATEVAEWAGALSRGSLLFLDPGPLAGDIPPSMLARVLPRCDWLSVSIREATLLTGADDPEGAASALASRTSGGVIVRTGPSGCVLAPGAHSAGGPEVTRVPAPKVDAIDTTGAGDAHAGAFLAALADGLSPVAAARRANAAAALAVTRRGPATAPTRSDLDAWLADPRAH